MNDKMSPIPLKDMLSWIFAEYRDSNSIFGIPAEKFYHRGNARSGELFGESLGTPIGPAAGPHTQMTQNLVAAYLTGGRFFELKTVQIKDELEFPKPCIAAGDEGYNTEWSTELSVEGAFAEYLKAWFILHVLQKEIFHQDERDFIFNMSIGYNLEGIRSPKVDAFIEGLKNAGGTELFGIYKGVLREAAEQLTSVDRDYIEGISANICRSVTLSTMHGCPPSEIDAICRYLLTEKKLHTFVKMNPTLLGYDFAREAFAKTGFAVRLKEESFTHDLQYADGVAMLKGLKILAASCGKEFGVKVSNTLPVQITQAELPGQEMYMSGRSLYPLSITLAYRLASEFDGDLKISFAGGADYFNVAQIYATGIRPITMATTLLKPGGYYRLRQLATLLASNPDVDQSRGIDLGGLGRLADGAFTDQNYAKAKRPVKSRKIPTALPLTDCFVAPCARGCPIGQDIPEYIRLVGEKKYEEAYKVILDKNPLPFITGTICAHFCMSKCTRLDYDDSVLIREVKLLAAKNGSRPFLEKVVPSNPERKVAVLGAGPSGLAAAYFLARSGIGVTVIDKSFVAGGTVARVIPDFRISQEAIDLDLLLIQRMGVQFELGSRADVTVAQLKARGFKYVYLAVGAGKSKPLALAGDTQRVTSALAFLAEYKQKKANLVMKGAVAVIGGGNTAMDAARAALRTFGVEKVYIVYRRDAASMPALAEEVALAVKEGVVLKELLAPVELERGVLRCAKMELGDWDASGRRGVVARAGEYEDIAVDFVLSAIGEQVDSAFLSHAGLSEVMVDPVTLETELPNVFLGGDALSGPGSVVEAIADGKMVAEVICAREKVNTDFTAEARTKSDILAKKGVLAASELIEREPERCLECSYECNICLEVCPNRANVAIKVAGDEFKDLNQIVHLDGLCNQCGNCATFCPYSGAPYKDKFTLYWSESEFHSGTNPGFVWLGGETKFLVRLADQEILVQFTGEGKTDGLPQPIARLLWTAFRQYRYLFTNVNQG